MDNEQLIICGDVACRVATNYQPLARSSKFSNLQIIKLSNLPMTDIFSTEKRSDIMSKIRSKNTKPEVKLRKALFARGFRYRTNDKRLPGTPDIVLRKYGTVIFVNGCFWHHHPDCKIATMPKTNTEFWQSKIKRNRQRDLENYWKLGELGWEVIVVWECELNHAHAAEAVADKIAERLHRKLSPTPISYDIPEESEIRIAAENNVEYGK